MHQLLLGAALPFVVAVLIYIRRGYRASAAMLVLAPLLMGIGALWAVVPDLPRLVGWDSLYMRLASDPRMDIFFWHYTIDRIETDSSWYNLGVVLMLAALMTAAWRELRRAEEET